MSYLEVRMSEIRAARSRARPKKTAPILIGPSEHQVQAAVIQWWAYACKRYGLPAFALFAIPNGGGRSPGQAGRLKAEGVRPGVSDLFLAVPRGSHAGLFLEMKAPRGNVSIPQKSFQDFARGIGYETALAYSFDQAVTTIQAYLRPRAT